jgi:hypothetical protein
LLSQYAADPLLACFLPSHSFFFPSPCSNSPYNLLLSHCPLYAPSAVAPLLLPCLHS